MTVETPAPSRNSIPAHATPADRSSPNTDLGLSVILPGSLPPTLGTPAAPDRYQVDAVFTRRPLPEEVEAIDSSAPRDALSAAGYPGLTLRVSDRRLEIGNSNLEELEGGLSTVLADLLAQISRRIRQDQAQAFDRAAAAADVEHTRSEDVIRQAGRITFHASSPSD
ncbi:hypothetical protein [Microbacterium sp.]|jgi:hypothetical protein|uniref:hypothetical protein n=1 Tax=Microbacterium sp. TaxID=51671 RepID=UPI0025F36944|nr:hypothetical protein [Microbacterium sp.]MBT9606464.1 hypothetical protein [Microbacterium sp.]